MWEEYRERKLEGFLKAKNRGELDSDIVKLLDTINLLENYVTLSSCSGRIVVIDIPEVGDKRRAKFLGKWHDEVDFEVVLSTASKSENWGWLIQYPPIIHVACRTLDDAERLMIAANDAGFRRSGIISVKNHVVEVASLERIELPVARSGRILVSENYLRSVVEFANIKLKKGKERLERLYNLIKAFSE